MKNLPTLYRSRIRISHLLVSAFLFFTATNTSRAASYTITVPAYFGPGTGDFFAAYHFQTNTVANVFAPTTLPWGTTLYIWDNTQQNWITQYLDDLDENWLPNPNYVLKPGDVFFIRNAINEDIEVTISGSEISGTKTFNLYADEWNGYGTPKLPPNGAMLECIPNCDFGTGMSYSGQNEDELWWWNPSNQTWMVETRTTTGGGIVSWGGSCDGGIAGKMFWGDPSVLANWLGWGAFFRPVQNKSWTFAVDICSD